MCSGNQIETGLTMWATRDKGQTRYASDFYCSRSAGVMKINFSR
jgi:hypothetical protein